MGHSVYTQYTPWYTQVWSLPNGLADSRKPRLFAYRAVHLMVCYEWYMHRPHYVSYQLYPLQYFKQSRRSTTATSNRARLFTRIHTVLSHNSLNVKVLSIVVLKMLSYTYSCWKNTANSKTSFACISVWIVGGCGGEKMDFPRPKTFSEWIFGILRFWFWL